MKTIVTWVWKGERDYSCAHATALSKMLQKRMRSDYRFIVIADDPRPLPGAHVMRTPRAALELAHLRTVEGRNFPTSFRRLWLFSEEARMLGDVVLLTDLDVVVTGDWSPLFDHMPGQDFIGWKPGQRWGNNEERVGGGTWRLRTGSHPEVWEDFVADPHEAMKTARGAGFRGSDQAWISYCLAHRVPIFPEWMGIHSVRDYTRDNRRKIVEDVDPAARCVHFNGVGKPWMKESWVQHPWLSQHWPEVVA